MPNRTKPSAKNAESNVEPNVGTVFIVPTKVRPNPLNPRQFFDQDSISDLADSIEKIGLLVPITVYEDINAEEGTSHVLLDGERRLRAAKLINMKLIAAWVIPKPDGVDNVVRMFNIHMLRREWDEIATAWALEKLQEELGTDSISELSRLTGLSRDRIKNMQTVLSFPKPFQERIAAGEIKFQYLVELEKNVLSKCRQDSEIANGYTEAEIRDTFVDKYLDDNAETVELRKVGKLISTAKSKGAAGDRARTAFMNLLQVPTMSIEEAYETGAAASIELNRVLRDMFDLPNRLEAVLESDLQEEQLRQIKQATSSLSAALNKISKGL